MPAVNVIDHPYSQRVETLFECVRDMPNPVWLDSGKPGSLQGKFDIISAAPRMLLETCDDTTTLTDHQGSTASREHPLILAEQLLQDMATPAVAGLPFCGGLLGYFGYDLGRRLLALPEAQPDTVGLPALRLGYYTWALVVNHQTHKACIVFHPACDSQLRNDILARLRALRGGSSGHFRLKEPFSASLSQHQYAQTIARIKAYIEAGDCYQVNFAQHFTATYEGDPWFAYRQLRTALPSPFSAFLSWQDRAILSLSPERFIKLSGKQVETKPIKGTAPRGITVAQDQANAIALVNSTKDRAENLMIVDLLRNDLGKSCRSGSIRVPKLFNLESFANVHHLVSTVTGTLVSGKSALDLLAGCFPGGSITGAPKKRAMEIIAECEQIQRSIYCGSIGYISACGHMDTNIAIRTLAANAGQLHCWGGGGIVADSTAEGEYEESISKISLLMNELSVAGPGR